MLVGDMKTRGFVARSAIQFEQLGDEQPEFFRKDIG